MRPAAELSRVAVDLDDPNFVPVLFPEEHHRAEVAGLRDRGHERADRAVLEHDLVDGMLDTLAFLGRQRLGMREVEAELVGPHRRAGLLDMVTEEIAKRLV